MTRLNLNNERVSKIVSEIIVNILSKLQVAYVYYYIRILLNLFFNVNTQAVEKSSMILLYNRDVILLD